MEEAGKSLQDIILKLKKYSTPKTYQCNVCRDSGWIEDNGFFRHCMCEKKRISEMRMKRNGLEAGTLTFKNFNVDTAIAKEMKSMADRYIAAYPDGSMAVLGQVGSGKTHVMIATAQTLIDKGKDVQYRSYVDMMATLRQNRYDEEGYQKLMDELKSCGLLVIDDLFKGYDSKSKSALNDLTIVFEIVNNRYLNRKPVLISSEYSMSGLVDIDEAIGTRLYQMCEKYQLHISKDPHKNRRVYD